ncbi:DUF4306 domain-containing protein [Planococcus sp. N064]|uniref:DUF4306 domain-containing protein n=1 Tax=Planococcus liqunii TaxID=3058394 RepID=A0ABT8MWT8_9BACL|nr:DUF4306 domain-containing protein [Planococcus sp. N064]MDN7229398.1 DUF4306 domain-containing protein [Planococcus sp. N064]
MPFKKIVLMSGAIVVFILAALISWYEGGQLRDEPWEWRYTAVFSNWANEGFTNADNLWILDHFVYAAKFEPLFPLVMAISFYFVLFQLTFWLFRGRRTVRNAILLLVASFSFLACYALFDSPTIGFQLFALLFGLAGALSVFRMIAVKSGGYSEAKGFGKGEFS